MRPDRFQDFAVRTIRDTAHPLVSGVLPIGESGETERGLKGDRIVHRYGMAVKLASGTTLRWHVVVNMAGNSWDGEEVPVEAEKPMAPIDGGDLPAKPDGPAAEAWLAGVLSGSGSREFERIDCWSSQDDARPGHHGLTVHCHSGVKLYVRGF